MAQKKFDNSTIAHLTMIQGVISRMGTNSFALKALAMTLASAVLAFSGAVLHPNQIYPLAAMLPVVVFWFMDAHYLRLEKLFRALYDEVRRGKLKEPFDMKLEPYQTRSGPTVVFQWDEIYGKCH